MEARTAPTARTVRSQREGFAVGETGSRVVVYEEPRDASPADVYRVPLTTLLAGGIVNPFGPMFTAVTALGEPRPGARLPLVYQMLNPLSQACQTVGVLVVGPRWDAASVVPDPAGDRAGVGGGAAGGGSTTRTPPPPGFKRPATMTYRGDQPGAAFWHGDHAV